MARIRKIGDIGTSAQEAVLSTADLVRERNRIRREEAARRRGVEPPVLRQEQQVPQEATLRRETQIQPTVTTPTQPVISPQRQQPSFPGIDLAAQTQELFSGRLESAREAERRAQERLTRGREEEERRLAGDISTIEQQVSAIFAPRRGALERSIGELEREASISQALAGTARGTRAAARQQLREDVANQRRDALAAEESLRREFLIAQAEGASDERLEALGIALTGARQNIEKIEQEAATFEAGLREDIFAANLATQQLQQRALFERQLADIPTAGERRKRILEEATIAGPGFLEGRSSEEIAQLEQEGGFTRGFLSQAISAIQENADPRNEFTFTAPKVDQFGRVVTPGYIFDKSKGTYEVVDPSTGQRAEILSGGEAVSAARTFKNFDDYIAQIGNGNVVKGSPAHKGFEVDIDGKIGDSITAFTGGEVKSVLTTCTRGDRKCGGGYGNNVVVELPDGKTVRYAHLDSVGVTPGDRIGAGQQIGTMGNTGFSIPMGGGDGSHLHIEARDKNNRLVSLQDFAPSTTIQPANADVNSILAEAASKGYISTGDKTAYLDAKRSGITLPDRINDLSPKEKLDEAQELRKEFDKNTEAARKALAQVDIMNRSLGEIKNQLRSDGVLNPASQGILVTFQKILDPTSVVRESEYARSGEGQALTQQVEARIQQLIEGGAGVSEGALEDFVTVANRWAEGYRDSIRDIGDRTKYIIENVGLDERFVFTEDSLNLLNNVQRPQVEDIDFAVEFLSQGQQFNDNFSSFYNSDF